ncbi:MAG: FGGY-family carbohydrate kinase [Acidobacteriaceae bacterium]
MTPADPRAVVAVDLGAQSCRVSLLRWLPDGPKVQLVHRVPNAPVARDGHLHWDLSMLCDAADEGLRLCAAIATEGIASIGVTGWAVDYVRLKTDNQATAENPARVLPIGDPFCYRDPRTGPAMETLHKRIGADRLYALTGIQVLPINTLYQLYADTLAGVPSSLPWLNLPEYMLYRWGAKPVAEYTNATHTAMVALGKQQWSAEILAATGIDPSAAPTIVAPGSIVGRLQGSLAELDALHHALLIAPACHDTASAIAGIHASGADWAYISSGTWSLVGTLLDVPCAGPEAARLNFTNEGGVGGKICFLRNVNALWLLNQCIEAWQAEGQHWTAEQLVEAAAKLPAPQALLDLDDPQLIAPKHMPEAIARQLENRGTPATPFVSSPAAMTNLILHSLAARYATLLHQVETLTGKHFRRLYVVGGGSRNALLTRLTQQATGLELICGAQESSTVGNFAIQIAALEKRHRSGTVEYRGDVAQHGVDHEAVAQWAGLLTDPSVHPPVNEMIHASPA